MNGWIESEHMDTRTDWIVKLIANKLTENKSH